MSCAPCPEQVLLGQYTCGLGLQDDGGRILESVAFWRDCGGEEMSVRFDVVSFTFDDLVREVEVLLHGKRIRIPQEKTHIPGLWLVQGDELRAALGDHFKVFYSMFFGVLLEALKQGEVRLPIESISLSDIDIAYQDGTLNTLAERIARSKPDSRAAATSSTTTPHCRPPAR